MPKGYVIAHVTVEDPEAFRTYVENNGASIDRYGGEVIIKGGQAEVLEGSCYEVHVVIAFPSIEDARAFYHDPIYQEVAKFRHGAGKNTLIVAEGGDDEALKAGGMAKGYILAHVTVHDMEAYKPYVVQNTPLLRARGARHLVRGGKAETLEGVSGDRHVLIQLPSYAEAQAAYHDPAYQKIADIRRANAESTVVVMEGVAP